MLQIQRYLPATTIAVPAADGTYATTYANFLRVTGEPLLPLDGVTVLVEAGILGADIEVWLLKAGGDPAVDADYYFGKLVVTSGASGAGGMGTVDVNWPGVQFRVKSLTATGNLTFSAIGWSREPRK